MTSQNKVFNRLSHASGILIVLLFGILTILGSGGGGGGVDEDDSGSGITALNFDANTSFEAALLAASTMSVFPPVTELVQVMLNALEASNPNNFPLDLGICVNSGDSIASWTDTDTSGDLSAGDDVSLQLTGCEIDGVGGSASGVMGMEVTSIDTDPLPNSIGLVLSMDIDITENAETMNYYADFGLIASTSDNTNFSYLYAADDASGQMIGVSENGSEIYQFGCFSVTEEFSTASSSGTYSLAPSGVINASDKIMSLAIGPALSFVSDTIESGTKRLLSISVPECATLGVPPTGVSGNDGSYMDMEALGGGMVRLHTYDVTDVEFYTLDISWNALLN